MSMYFCHYTFEGTHPKYMNEAMKLLTSADGKIFIDSGDVEILAFKVREALEKDKPKGSTANANKHTTHDGEIVIDVYATALKDVNSVGRAHFRPVSAIVTYDPDDKNFIEVKLKMEEKQS